MFNSRVTGEPKNIVDKTINFIEKQKPDYVVFLVFVQCQVRNLPKPKKYDIEFIDKNWDKHAHLLFRFSNNESVGLPFRYKKQTHWGNSFREEIILNIQHIKDGCHLNLWSINLS